MQHHTGHLCKFIRSTICIRNQKSLLIYHPYGFLLLFQKVKSNQYKKCLNGPRSICSIFRRFHELKCILGWKGWQLSERWAELILVTSQGHFPIYCCFGNFFKENQIWPVIQAQNLFNNSVDRELDSSITLEGV